MLRIVFLLSVVIGALAVLLALILGIGVAKVAVVNRLPDPPTTHAADVTAPPATQASPATAPAAPEPAAPPIVAGVVRPPAAPEVKPADFVLGMVVLRGGDAKLHGKTIQQTLPEGDITSWTRESDYAQWIFAAKPGKYFVDLTRSNGANSGGQFHLLLGGDRSGKVMLTARTQPTGGWDQFRTERLGVIELEGGRTAINISPAEAPSLALMRFRRLDLVPVDPAEIAAAALNPPPDKDKKKGGGIIDDDSAAILGLTLVDAASGRPIGAITNGMRLDLSTLGPVAVRAETTAGVGSVQFLEDGKALRLVDSERPFSIAGDRGNVYAPWSPPPGKMSLNVVPYTGPNASGKIGRKLSVHFDVRSVAGIVLTAVEAKLHGQEIRLEQETAPTITNWNRGEEWIEWQTGIVKTATHRVELNYSCDEGHGGEFVMRVGEVKLTGKVESTGNWGAYKWTTVGTVEIPRGQARVAIKPADLPQGQSLMKLREVRLVLVEKKD